MMHSEDVREVPSQYDIKVRFLNSPLPLTPHHTKYFSRPMTLEEWQGQLIAREKMLEVQETTEQFQEGMQAVERLENTLEALDALNSEKLKDVREWLQGREKGLQRTNWEHETLAQSSSLSLAQQDDDNNTPSNDDTNSLSD
ncbi:hypothetical protein Pcinc_039375 [Petrolisthes cinctipes]|uniref:Uncharacterized protein n=1 Tax=Petrolisthes cinctipes TaxID=88211 RepID=A0AAE1BRD7_PETCI|nr:hypothetical protein Pcinc_039375 [Petrolisthes cinctipes]